MKITVLSENTTCRYDCESEHGLSLLVETGENSVLFDTGQSSVFAINAERLGIDLGAVNICVLSHGHYDHGGGLAEFLRLNSAAQLYVSPYAFEPHYNGSEKYIGLNKELEASDRIVYVEKEISPVPGVAIVPWGDVPVRYPVNSFGLNKLDKGLLVPDDFRHEQYMLTEENGRRILFSGCSHKGVLSIVDRFRPDVLVGGFHFMKLDPDTEDAAELQRQASLLCSYDTVYYTCHCTGVEQYEFLRPLMGERLHYLAAGSVVEL